MNDTNKKTINILLFFIIILTSFLLGYYTSLQIINKNIPSIVINNPQTNLDANNINKNNNSIDLTLFSKVYDLVKNNYYSKDELDNKTLEYGAIKGFIDSIGDKHSQFLTPDETKVFEENLDGDFEGIGAVIIENKLGIEVDRVIKGSPALKSDIRSGDIIISANGVDLVGVPLNEAVNYIKGEKGTIVNLEILREGRDNIIKKSVTRDSVVVPSVVSETYDDIGYIALNVFGDHTSLEFHDELMKFKNNDNIDGLIIDLRDNGGGYLQSAVEILSEFIQNGDLLVTTKYKDSSNDIRYKSKNRTGTFNKKIVLLVNENSRSASEITTGALKDYNKAIIVGTTTYGKGSVQQRFDFPENGSMVKITIAKWYTPKDHSIEGNGILPDIEVKFTEDDYKNQYDRQLEVAKDILHKYIQNDSIDKTIDDYNKSMALEYLENIKDIATSLDIVITNLFKDINIEISKENTSDVDSKYLDDLKIKTSKTIDKYKDNINSIGDYKDDVILLDSIDDYYINVLKIINSDINDVLVDIKDADIKTKLDDINDKYGDLYDKLNADINLFIDKFNLD